MAVFGQYLFVVFSGLLQVIWTLQQAPDIILDNKKYVGCIIDQGIRTLANTNFNSSNLDNKMCIQFCRDRGYLFAGTESTNECYCGNDPYWVLKTNIGSAYIGTFDCNYKCGGDSSQICGGYWRLSVYRTGLDPPRITFNLLRDQSMKGSPFSKINISGWDSRIQHMICALLCDRDINCSLFSVSVNTCELYLPRKPAKNCYTCLYDD